MRARRHSSELLHGEMCAFMRIINVMRALLTQAIETLFSSIDLSSVKVEITCAHTAVLADQYQVMRSCSSTGSAQVCVRAGELTR